MSRLLVVLTVFVLLVPVVASAQNNGMIAVFTDPSASNCNFVDFGPSLIVVHYFHLFTTGAAHSQFKLNAPPTWVFLGDFFNFPVVIGNAMTGVAVAYGACLPGPVHIGYSNFFVTGLSPPCTPIGIGPDPAALSGLVEASDCNFNLVFPDPGQGIVNTDGRCSCFLPLPVEETTWGRVKGLYQ